MKEQYPGAPDKHSGSMAKQLSALINFVWDCEEKQLAAMALTEGGQLKEAINQKLNLARDMLDASLSFPARLYFSTERMEWLYENYLKTLYSLFNDYALDERYDHPQKNSHAANIMQTITEFLETFPVKSDPTSNKQAINNYYNLGILKRKVLKSLLHSKSHKEERYIIDTFQTANLACIKAIIYYRNKSRSEVTLPDEKGRRTLAKTLEKNLYDIATLFSDVPVPIWHYTQKMEKNAKKDPLSPEERGIWDTLVIHYLSQTQLESLYAHPFQYDTLDDFETRCQTIQPALTKMQLRVAELKIMFNNVAKLHSQRKRRQSAPQLSSLKNTHELAPSQQKSKPNTDLKNPHRPFNLENFLKHSNTKRQRALHINQSLIDFFDNRPPKLLNSPSLYKNTKIMGKRYLKTVIVITPPTHLDRPALRERYGHKIFKLLTATAGYALTSRGVLLKLAGGQIFGGKNHSYNALAMRPSYPIGTVVVRGTPINLLIKRVGLIQKAFAHLPPNQPLSNGDTTRPSNPNPGKKRKKDGAPLFSNPNNPSKEERNSKRRARFSLQKAHTQPHFFGSPEESASGSPSWSEESESEPSDSSSFHPDF